MKFPCGSNIFIIVILIFAIQSYDGNKLIVVCNKTETNMWMDLGKMTGLLFHNCMQLGFHKPQEQFLIILQRCLKRRSLLALDRSLRHDVIEITNGIRLVRKQVENDTYSSRGIITKFDEEEANWKAQVFQRFLDVFNTHVIKIYFNDNEGLEFEARRRHRRNSMMPIMMFGVLALGMIMIPMGFQFLAVLGGKALLLAKMALLLTSIQGLKKIATSNVNYGLYSTPNQGHCKDELSLIDCYPLDNGDSVFVSLDIEDLSQQGHYDRQWPYDGEGHDVSAFNNNNYYDIPDQQVDLLHPLHPRIDSFQRKYIIEN